MDEDRELLKVIRWIDDRFSGLSLPGDERSRLAAGCFDVSLEHQAAISLLSTSQLYGPMFALLRVLTESVVRGLWLAQCATNRELSKFKKHKLDKHFATLIEEIEETIGYDDSPLSTLKKNSWNAMNGFTHTGFYQVARRNSDEITGPNYPEKEISQALALAGAMGLLAANQLAGIAGERALVEATKERMKEYANRAL